MLKKRNKLFKTSDFRFPSIIDHRDNPRKSNDKLTDPGLENEKIRLRVSFWPSDFAHFS